MAKIDIDLDNEELEKNKAFLRALFTSENLDRPLRYFQIRRGSEEKKEDEDMNLESFLGLMNEKFSSTLIIGGPLKDEIGYTIRGIDPNGYEIFAWVECPHNESNHNRVARIYGDVYHRNLNDEITSILESCPRQATDEQMEKLLETPISVCEQSKPKKLINGVLARTPSSDSNQWRYPYCIVFKEEKLPVRSRLVELYYIPIPHERSTIQTNIRTIIEADVLSYPIPVRENTQEYKKFENLPLRYIAKNR